jgi:hypothetical protein
MPVDLKKIEASLSSMSVAKRQELYRNACRLKTREAQSVERMIADSGLPYIVGCITKDDPEWDMLEKIVKSAEVREAAVAAVSAGFPALAGADPILQREMGGRYGLHNMTVQTAGDFVANLMRSLGYREAGRGDCPNGCVARTGLRWRPKGA